MRRVLVVVTVTTLILSAAGCWGRAALEAYELDGDGKGDGGSGGSGGTTTTSTSSTNTSTTSTSSSSTNTSTSTGPIGECDFSGECGFCSQCAYEGPCQPLWQICFNSQPCVEFLSCFEMCQGEPGCFLGCAQDNEAGAEVYLDALQCTVCQECKSDCDGQFPLVCN
jgi:hypothetical protein